MASRRNCWQRIRAESRRFDPKENEKDLADIPENVKRGLEIIPVSLVDDVLERALTATLVPIEWDERDEMEADQIASATGDEGELGGVVKH